jgi:phosphate transport system substrate-binding protein
MKGVPSMNCDRSGYPWRVTTSVFLLLVLLAPGATTPADAPPSVPLVFAGSGSNLAIIRLQAKEFGRAHPEIKIEVPASIGSTGGIRAAADGAVAMGLVSRPLNEREKGLGLAVLPYARTAVVIGAHPSVADDGITSEELVRIYKGAKTRWKDGREIIVLTREPGDSSIEVLEREIQGFKDAYAESHRAKRWTTLYTDQKMNQVLARTPYAIGLSDMGAITAERLPIKALKVSGVPPTAENVSSGRYALVKTLAFVFLKDKLPAGTKAFLDFVRSREGEKILRANGYLPGE